MLIGSPAEHEAYCAQREAENCRGECAQEAALRDVAGHGRVRAGGIVGDAQDAQTPLIGGFALCAQRIAADCAGTQQKEEREDPLADAMQGAQRAPDCGQTILQRLEANVDSAQRRAQMQRHAQRAQQQRGDDALDECRGEGSTGLAHKRLVSGNIAGISAGIQLVLDGGAVGQNRKPCESGRHERHGYQRMNGAQQRQRAAEQQEKR